MRSKRDQEYDFNKGINIRLAKEARNKLAHRMVIEEYPDDPLLGMVHRALRRGSL